MMNLRFLGLLSSAVIFAAACSPEESSVSEPEGAAQYTPLPDEFEGAEQLYASAEMEGFEKFPSSLILDRSQAFDLLERAYAGSNGVSGFVVVEGVSYSAEPRLAFTYLGKDYLVVAHAEDNAAHVAGGSMSYFVFDSDSGPPAFRLPFLLYTGSWGAEPQIEAVRLSNGEPAAIVSGGGTFQGCTFGGSEIIRFTEAGIVASPFFPVYHSNDPTIHPPIQIDLVGIQLSADGTSMALRYLGERDEGGIVSPIYENRTLPLTGSNPWMEDWEYWC